MKNARNQHRTDYAKELVKIVQTTKDREELKKKIAAYHERDIANAIVESDKTVRKCIYDILDIADIAEIFSYIEEEPGKYLEEMPIEQAAKVVSNMDSDDAMDLFEELNEEDKYKLLKRLDKEAKEDVQKLLSYEEDQIGSCMTNNYIVVRNDVTIREAMSTLVKQAGEHDNIQTLYVIDENGIFAGAIDLKDLIIAREHDNLQDIISSSYPYVYEHEKISECMEILTDYEEDSIPVLTQDKKIAGILTSSDIVELVDDEMGDDYAKLAGLTEEEDLNEPTIVSMKKRLPWLIALLFLGMAVSSVVGMFESIVAVLPIVICFQSLVLDMAGNVGTQSLAVTIRVLMDENLTASDKLKLTVKEMKVGFSNGILLGVMAVIFVGLYIFLIKGNDIAYSFIVSGCVGFSLLASMVISSLIGTLVPMFFNKMKIDPAVASGPLITTINDLVAVVTYYGMVWLLLINILHLT
jgi:magnesium transporter